MIAAGETGPTLMGRLLSWRPVVFIGLILLVMVFITRSIVAALVIVGTVAASWRVTR